MLMVLLRLRADAADATSDPVQQEKRRRFQVARKQHYDMKAVLKKCVERGQHV